MPKSYQQVDKRGAQSLNRTLFCRLWELAYFITSWIYFPGVCFIWQRNAKHTNKSPLPRCPYECMKHKIQSLQIFTCPLVRATRVVLLHGNTNDIFHNRFLSKSNTWMNDFQICVGTVICCSMAVWRHWWSSHRPRSPAELRQTVSGSSLLVRAS